jgi:hypothetical protein
MSNIFIWDDLPYIEFSNNGMIPFLVQGTTGLVILFHFYGKKYKEKFRLINDLIRHLFTLLLIVIHDR